MKRILVCFMFVGLMLKETTAQVGRHEEPVDTISIGGDVQERQMIQMEEHDRLQRELVLLRDSLAGYVSEKSNSPGVDKKTMKNVTTYRERIDELLAKMKETERDMTLMKEGQVLLKEGRREFRRASGDSAEVESH